MDSQWLKIQFKLNPDKTKAGLAKAVGLDPPAISKILGGTRQIKAQEYMRMRAYFDLEVETRLDQGGIDYKLHKPSSPDSKRQSGFEEMAGAASREDWTVPAGIITQRSKSPPQQIKIFEIRESTMEPDFYSGEHVLVDLSDSKPLKPGPYIVSDGFGYMVRFCEFLPGPNPSEVRISASSPKFLTQILPYEDFDILGRVIAKLQML